MNQLITYVSALKGEPTTQSIVEIIESDTSFTDGDTQVHGCERLIKFTNGVTLKQLVEEEFVEVEFVEVESSTDSIDADNSVCSECWISYEVVAQPYNLSITPRRKNFINRCQEAFWLKISNS